MKIIDRGKIIFLVTDKAGRINSVNNYGLIMLGSSGSGGLVGKNIQDYYAHPVDRGLYLDKLEKNGFIKDFEIRLVNKSGEIITCLENAVILNERIESVIIDISDFINTNIETIKLNIQLADINKKLKDAYNTMAQQEKLASVGELAAGIAHEINNPLGFIMSNSRSFERYIEMLGDFYRQIKSVKEAESVINEGNLDFILSDLKDILKENNDGLQRIARITESLKRFSRMDSESRTDKYDLNQAVFDTLTIAKSHYKYTASIETNLENIPLFSCYGDSLNQVLLNLIVNASQAIGSSGGSKKGIISISTGIEKGYVVFRISDNGPGVSDKQVRKIFDPFFTTKEVGEGTGLGLSLCYDIIVNKHSGAIWYEKNKDGGADFIFRIPLVMKDE